MFRSALLGGRFDINQQDATSELSCKGLKSRTAIEVLMSSFVLQCLIRITVCLTARDSVDHSLSGWMDE